MTPAVGRGMRRLSAATVIVTYLLVVAGGVVRVTGSGLGCGVTGQDWPVCHGGLVPPPDLATLIEFNHRMFATASTILIGVLCVVAWLRYRHDRRLTIASSAAVVLLIVQILLGAITVELKLPGEIVMVHLANALLLLGVLVYIAATAHTAGTAWEQGTPTRHRRLLVGGALSTYVLVLTGALVVSQNAGYACSGWPLCGNGFTLPSRGLAELNVVHRIIAGVVVLFLGYAMAKVRRSTADRATRAAAMAVNIALVLQIAVGAAAVETRLPSALRGTHIALASLVWALTLLVALLARREQQASADLRGQAATVHLSGAAPA
jgi:heme A synthase